MKAKINLLNIMSYLVGNFRYALYYDSWKFLIRRHIYQQITWRIEVMDQECYQKGSCKLCGCSTTALQMANKACDKPCYPSMMGRRKWKKFLNGEIVYDGGRKGFWQLNSKTQLIKFKTIQEINELEDTAS